MLRENYGEGNGTPLQHSCLENPTDCSLPGSSVHGIFQARVLEWGASDFSEEALDIYIKYKMVKIIAE